MNPALSETCSRMHPEQFSNLMKGMSQPGLLNLGGGNLCSSFLPLNELNEDLSSVLCKNGAAVFQYGSARGCDRMVSAAQSYLSQFRGIKAREEEILIVNGGTQGLSLAFEAVLKPGDVVLTEEPTFLIVFLMFQRLNVRCIGVRMDENGILPDDLKEKINKYRPKALYTIPTFQNPTSTVTSLERKREILSIAEASSMYIIEDDPYYDLRFSGDPIPTYYNMLPGSSVIAVNSFSKIVSPGLRVGTVCAHEKIISAMLTLKQCSDMHTSGLSQILCADFILSDKFRAHIRRLTGCLEKNLAVMVQGAKRNFSPDVSFASPSGGIFLWVEMPEDVPVLRLNETAARLFGVTYIPGSVFYPVPNQSDRHIRLNFGGVTAEEITEGMDLLGQLFFRER